MGMRSFSFNDIMFLLQATQWTLYLAGIAFVGGGLLGVLVTLARISRVEPLRWLAIGYVEVLQGTPLLMQLFLWFFMLSVLLPMQLPAIMVAGMALSLNASSFFVEIWRGSIEAIPRTQWESAASIGMTRMQQLRYAIVPQAFRIALPPTVGLLVVVIKSTALTSLIGFLELVKQGQLISGVTFQPMPVFLSVAAIYLVICTPIAAVSHLIERKLYVNRPSNIRL